MAHMLGGFVWRWRKSAARPTAYLHIPKCAGSTVNEHLKRHLGSVRSGRAVMINSIDVAQGSAACLEGAKSARYVAGHCGWDHISGLGRTHVRFTFLRNPAERVLSFYGFCRSLPERKNSAHFPLQSARTLSFEAFCRSEGDGVRMFVDNAQARALACDYTRLDGALPADWRRRAEENLAKLDFVGLSERLDDQFPSLCALIGIPPPGTPSHKNVGLGQDGTLPSPEEAAAILGDRTAADEELYRRVEEGWTARCRWI